MASQPVGRPEPPKDETPLSSSRCQLRKLLFFQPFGTPVGYRQVAVATSRPTGEPSAGGRDDGRKTVTTIARRLG